MKKKYIIPEVQIVTIEVEHLIAESLGLRSTNITDESKVLIKRDRQSYSVWDEDWSN